MKILLALLVTVLLLVPSSVRPVTSPEVVFIAHQEVGDEHLSSRDIKNIFLGKKSTWTDGSQISFAVLADGELHEEFLQQWIKRSQSQYVMYWRRMVFTGRASSLKVFNTETDLMKYVAVTEGAIAYVDTVTELVDVKPIPIIDSREDRP